MSASFLVLLYETAPSCFMKPPRARKRNNPLFRHFVTPSPQGEGKGKYPRAACATRARLDSNVKCIV